MRTLQRSLRRRSRHARIMQFDSCAMINSEEHMSSSSSSSQCFRRRRCLDRSPRPEGNPLRAASLPLPLRRRSGLLPGPPLPRLVGLDLVLPALVAAERGVAPAHPRTATHASISDHNQPRTAAAGFLRIYLHMSQRVNWRITLFTCT